MFSHKIMSLKFNRGLGRTGWFLRLACRHAVAWTGVVIVESWIFAPPLALAGLASLKPFKPVLGNSHGVLTLNSVYAKSGKETNRGLNDSNRRIGFRESLNLSTLGYVYSPNLVLFDLSGTTGKDQTRIYEYDILQGEDRLASNRHDSFDGYDLNALFLRQKPYTLELFTSRDKKFATSATDFSLDNEEIQEFGGEFKYNKRVYKTKFKYLNTQKSNDDAGDDIDFFDMTFDLYKPKLWRFEDFMTSFSTRFQDISRTLSTGKDGGGDNTRDSALANRFAYKMFDFSTNISSLNSQFEDTPVKAITPSYTYDLLSVTENIGIDLPWDLASRLLLTKNMGNDESSSSGVGTELSRHSESTRDDEGYNFNLTHKLYDSLNTTLSVDKKTMFSSRSESIVEETGITRQLAPVEGQNDTSGYELGSRYRKLLPHDSLATAFVSIRSNDTNRAGLVQNIFQKDLAEQEFVDLESNVDTSSLVFEVLNRKREDTTECQSALRYVRSDNPCWQLVPETAYIVEPNKTVVNSASGRTESVTRITLEDTTQLQAVMDVANYHSYGIDDRFIFRVKSTRRPADFTSKTNRAGVGLTLFQFISSEYQHSVTSQEGSYSAYTLEPKVIDDLFALGFSVSPFTVRASREWIRATGEEVISELRLAYEKSMRFFDRIAVSLGAEAHTAFSDATDGQGNSSPSSEDGYSYRLDARTPLPYINVNFRGLSQYTFTRGEITRLLLNEDGGVIPRQSFGIGDRSVFQNSLSLSKPFFIPWVDFSLNTYVRYLWETTTTNDDTTERDAWQYGLNALRVWRLGATTINLKANYAITEENSEDQKTLRWRGTGTTREERTDNTSVILSIVRQLF